MSPQAWMRACRRLHHRLVSNQISRCRMFRVVATMLLLAAARCFVQGGELSVSPRLESDMALERAVEYLLAGRGEDGLWGEDAVSAETMMALYATGFQGEFASVRSAFDQAWDRLSARAGRFSPLALSHVIRVLRRKGEKGAKLPSENWHDWEASVRHLTEVTASYDGGECIAGCAVFGERSWGLHCRHAKETAVWRFAVGLGRGRFFGRNKANFTLRLGNVTRDAILVCAGLVSF